MYGKKEIYALLDERGIEYEAIEHEARGWILKP